MTFCCDLDLKHSKTTFSHDMYLWSSSSSSKFGLQFRNYRRQLFLKKLNPKFDPDFEDTIQTFNITLWPMWPKSAMHFVIKSWGFKLFFIPDLKIETQSFCMTLQFMIMLHHKVLCQNVKQSRRECKIYLNNGGYSRAKIIHILRLLHEDIGHHFGQQGSICMSIQSTKVEQFRNIKQEILIDDLSKHLRSQPVLLSTDNSKQMVQYSDHYRLHMNPPPPPPQLFYFGKVWSACNACMWGCMGVRACMCVFVCMHWRFMVLRLNMCNL